MSYINLMYNYCEKTSSLLNVPDEKQTFLVVKKIINTKISISFQN